MLKKIRSCRPSPDPDRPRWGDVWVVTGSSVSWGVWASSGPQPQTLPAHLSTGKQKRPRQIEIVSELPKNFLGKIQRRRLRESRNGTPANGQAKL